MRVEIYQMCQSKNLSDVSELSITYLQVLCSLQFLQQVHFLSNTPILLVQLLDLEQNFFFSFLPRSLVSVQEPPCKKVALQQVEEGHKGAGVVVVDLMVV